MTSPRAVVFDLGKVLVDFDYGIAARKMEARGRLSAQRVRDLLDQSALLHRYECGHMTTAEFFAIVREATQFSGELDEFRGFFGDIFAPIEPMIELHAKLRDRGVPTYIFSNTNEMAIGHIRRNFPFFAHFNKYVLSYEHGAMKPSVKLYEVVEQCTGLRGADLLYVDDRPENIEAGAARGWQVILHEQPALTTAEVQRLGLL